MVHFEADGKDKAGRRHYVIDGQDREPADAQPLHHRHLEEPGRERRVQDRAGSSGARALGRATA